MSDEFIGYLDTIFNELKLEKLQITVKLKCDALILPSSVYSIVKLSSKIEIYCSNGGISTTYI